MGAWMFDCNGLVYLPTRKCVQLAEDNTVWTGQCVQMELADSTVKILKYHFVKCSLKRFTF